VPHPGAVRVLDDDSDKDGTTFLVMELLDGETVRDLWERAGRVLPVRQVAHLSHQLLDVLWAAHANGIIHRDIKPDNLFVLRDGTLKVLDFGIASVHDSSDALMSRTIGVVGTPGYMPPEQVRGDPYEIDARTDLWSVGATMFAMLTGGAPHRAETSEEVMARTLTRPVTPLVELAAHVPVSIARVVDRALAMNRADRFPDAPRMQAALAEAYQAAFGESLPVGYLDVMVARASSAGVSFRPASTTGGLSAAYPLASIPVPRRVPSRALVWGGFGIAAVALLVLLVGLASSEQQTASSASNGMLPSAHLELPSLQVVELRAAGPAFDSLEDASRPSGLLQGDRDPIIQIAPKRSISYGRPSASAIHELPAPNVPTTEPTDCDPPWTLDPITLGRKVKPGC